METSVVLVLGLGLVSAAWLSWSLRDRWWRAGIPASLWNLVEVSVGLFLMMSMVYTASTQVIVRYGLSEYISLPWTEELSRLLLVWVAFWGAAMVHRSDGHIAVAVFFNLLSPNARRVIRLFGDLATLFFLGIVGWYGWWSAQLQLDITMISLQLSSGLFALSVPICGAIMLVHTIALTMSRMKEKSLGGTGVHGV